ncbi:hypothetical protein BKA61DRAFT_618906 [Leptodontidium sp. MPI-SDFR-AT-0119]|nr:hypothetical protein BKA61DRAFT_618906 [Leptodontidium sp. MPI-SDFR-AT-0119]
MLVYSILLPVLAGAALATPLPEGQDIAACRAKATTSLEQCACFADCVATPTEHGYMFSMSNSNSSSAARAAQDGCSNPAAHVTTSNTDMNWGSTPPFNTISHIFQSCGQYGCDPNPATESTIILGISGGQPVLTQAKVVATGHFRDWPDRDAACSLARAAAQAAPNVQYRTPGVHCRPGVDCDAPDPMAQYYAHNYYQVDHWNDCGWQAGVTALISIDSVQPQTALCSAAIGAIGSLLGPLFGEYAWLFGKITAVCNF